MRQWIFKNPNRLRRALNLWPPFLFTGIKIEYIANDFRTCRVKLRNWPGTRNVNGTQFGGSLFAMTDTIYSTMFIGILGEKYFVWDKSAHIDFEKPGKGMVYSECHVSDEMIADIHKNTADGQKYLPEVVNIIHDQNGDVVAKVSRVLYVRLKPEFRPKG